MRASRIELALEEGLFALPETGQIAVFRPHQGDDLSALPKDRVVVLTGFRPDSDYFKARGYQVESAAPAGAAPYAAALVCLPRARDHAKAMLAEAAVRVAPGATVLVDGQKTDGIESILKDLKPRVALSGAISKAHGRIAAFAAGPELADWADQPRQVEGGFITRAGVFSADGPDPASVLLAEHLPEKLGPKVVDLGAGWGYLSRAILARASVKRLDLVEAEALSLECARQNIDDPRANFHWEDATAFRPANLAETVVMNPPFHIGRSSDPTLGIAFITAARRMLAPDGALWMVANRHLPYDEALTTHFLEVETVVQTNSFRVIRAIKPRRQAR
ncbi:class I SAM-dependent methyltransferase [Xinfangfangia sp. D13-10-4-6]|uniref:class I SAM-dependent methyltransferase n=1 Tax=Pseudogemmobacter hezensis TaxID=2737662 RepID=UPI0015531B55|nr:class I SAM-dependent methyltransferase [Pseudogemmobacter hezensis]NPD14394.1 class I SAM-dependent methyltransferase [Pseudogemmobacter hezensis]